MAELVPLCKDRTGGVQRPFVFGDTLTDEQGNIIQGGGGNTNTGTRTIVVDKLQTAGGTDPSSGTLGTDLDTLDFASGATESQKMEFTVPQDYNSGPLTIFVQYAVDGTSGGTVDFDVSGEIAELGGSVTAIGSSTEALTVTTTANAPDQVEFYVITSNNFGIGDRIRLEFERQGTTDSNTDVFKLLSFTINYVGLLGTGGVYTTDIDLVNSTDETAATPGTLGTDLDTIDYPTGSDTEQKLQTVVPDEWDGTSDPCLKITYAMSTAVASSVVKVETAGEVADVDGGTINALSVTGVEVDVPSTTNITRTVIRFFPAASFTKGSVCVIKVARRTSGLSGTNHTGSWKVLSYEVTFNTAGGSSTIPSGTVVETARATAPSGWLICDGAAVSRTTYAGLFAAIGDTYGVGDGSTTFNLPDTRGKSPLGANNSGLPNGADGGFSTRNIANTGGAETHTLTVGEMPSHGHSISGNMSSTAGTDTARWAAGTTPDLGVTPSSGANPNGGGGAHNTMHPFIVFNYMIKT